jgi:hypothetical protein
MSKAEVDQAASGWLWPKHVIRQPDIKPQFTPFSQADSLPVYGFKQLNGQIELGIHNIEPDAMTTRQPQQICIAPKRYRGFSTCLQLLLDVFQQTTEIAAGKVTQFFPRQKRWNGKAISPQAGFAILPQNNDSSFRPANTPHQFDKVRLFERIVAFRKLVRALEVSFHQATRVVLHTLEGSPHAFNQLMRRKVICLPPTRQPTQQQGQHGYSQAKTNFVRYARPLSGSVADGFIVAGLATRHLDTKFWGEGIHRTLYP